MVTKIEFYKMKYKSHLGITTIRGMRRRAGLQHDVFLKSTTLDCLSVNFDDESDHFLEKLACALFPSSNYTLNYHSRVFSTKFTYSLDQDLLGDD